MLVKTRAKRNAPGTGAIESPAIGEVLYGHAVGGKRETKLILSFERNVVSPYRSPYGESRPQGKPTAVRVKDEEKANAAL